DSGFEGEDLAGNHINTVGVINPYSVQPASISRVVIVSLPVWVANSLMVALGLRAAPVVVEDSKDSESVDDEGLEADDAQDIVRQAIENAANPPEPAAKKLPAVDPEVAAKKAAKKAAKAEARRRRMPVV
ncbi:hypothetical protein GGI06_000771, partial [Coemansia sp. S85]